MWRLIPTTQSSLLLAVVAISGFLLRLLWPGDVAFINDEPVILAQAIDAWSQGRWWSLGLQGSQGWHYGPLPHWFYGSFLALKVSLPMLVMIKAALAFTLTLVGAWLFWDEKLKTLALALLLAHAPYLVFYDRSLWDNVFLIPLTALGLGLYRQYHLRLRLELLAASFFCLTLALLAHLMALPSFLAVLGHFVIAEYSRGRINWRQLGSRTACIVLGCLVFVPYFLTAFTHKGAPRPEASWTPMAFWHGISGVQFFSLHGLEYFLGEGREPFWYRTDGLKVIWNYLEPASYFVFGLALAGLGAIFTRARLWRDKWLDPVWALPILIVALQVAQCMLGGIVAYPHYHNGSWMGFFGFLVMGVDWLRRFKRSLYVLNTLALAIVLGSWLMAYDIHKNGGNRSLHYGPTLENSLAIAKKLNQLQAHPQSLVPRVLHYRYFPHTLNFLRWYVAGRQPVKASVQAPLELRYLQPSSEFDGRIGIFLPDGIQLYP